MEASQGNSFNLDPRKSTMNASRTLVAIAALVLAAGPAQAGTRHTTVTGPQGASASRTVQRGDGQVTDTTTGPNGNSRVRAVGRTAGETTASLTHANGTTSSRVTNRTSTGSTTTLTGPQGASGTVTVTH